MAVMISSGFLIAWTPYVAVSFWSMRNSQRHGHLAPSVTLLPCLFAKSSTAYNPFIYFFFQRNTGHKLLPFHRHAFTCSDQADSSREGEKEESKVSKSLGFACFGAGTYETCPSLAGAQSQREMADLGWCRLLSCSYTLSQMYSLSMWIEDGRTCTRMMSSLYWFNTSAAVNAMIWGELNANFVWSFIFVVGLQNTGQSINKYFKKTALQMSLSSSIYYLARTLVCDLRRPCTFIEKPHYE